MSIGFDRILAAVDFSPDSIGGVRAAAETARLHSAALLVFHVIEAEPSPAPAGTVLTLIEKANGAMATLVEGLRPTVNKLALTTEVTTGNAGDEIVARACDWSADLVVLGAKGTATLEDVILGGIARSVVERAPCSVLAVRGRAIR